MYKGEYHPSYLLDPETYEWNLLDKDMKKLLGESKYVCPSARAREQSGEQQLTGDTKNDTAKDVTVANPQHGEGTEKEDENEEDDRDDEEEYDHDFVSGMPGTLTGQQLEEFDIGNVKIKIGEVQAQAKVMACAVPFCRAECWLTREHNRILLDLKPIIGCARFCGKRWLPLEQRLQEICFWF